MDNRLKDVEQPDGFRFTIPPDCGITVREAHDLLRQRQEATRIGDQTKLNWISDVFTGHGLVLKDVGDKHVAITREG